MKNETRDKISAAHQGKRHTKRTRHKIHVARLGKPWSDARRERFERKKAARLADQNDPARAGVGAEKRPAD